MRSKMLTAVLVVLVAAAPTVSFAQGTSGAQFLGLGVGPRAAAMGGAYSSVADDGTALHWNPAGLARVEGRSVTLSHVSWLSDASYQFASYAAPLGDRGAVGVALQQGSVSWDNTGAGDFEAGDFAGVVGYGRTVRPNLGVGADLKFLSSKLGDEGAASYAVDLGAVYRVSDSATLGAAARNIGPGLKFVDESDPLPSALVVGGSYEWNDVLVSMDIEKVNDLSATTRLGAEYSPVPYLSLRGGYIAGEESALSSVTGGVGVNWDRWALDYAYRGSEIGGTHQFALSAGLGGGGGMPVGGGMAAAVSATGSDVKQVAGVAKTNLAVITELVGEVASEAATRMDLPPGAHVYLRQIETSDANWLVKSVLLEELTSRGHVVRSGQMSAAPAAPAGAPEPEGPPVYEVAYRIVNCQTTLPRSWREWVVGKRKFERRTAVDIRFEVSDRTKSIVWAGGVDRERREIITGARMADLAAPGQSFASPTVEPGGWDKVFEPVIVAGIVGGLIFLFYTSRSTD